MITSGSLFFRVARRDHYLFWAAPCSKVAQFRCYSLAVCRTTLNAFFFFWPVLSPLPSLPQEKATEWLICGFHSHRFLQRDCFSSGWISIGAEIGEVQTHNTLHKSLVLVVTGEIKRSSSSTYCQTKRVFEDTSVAATVDEWSSQECFHLITGIRCLSRLITSPLVSAPIPASTLCLSSVANTLYIFPPSWSHLTHILKCLFLKVCNLSSCSSSS